MPTIFSLVLGIIDFINFFLVPLVFALAFILFLWGIFQGFIVNGADEKKRSEGKKFALWGIVGLGVMFSVWGLVNLLVNTFGFNGQSRPNLPTFGPSQQQRGTVQTAPTGGAGGLGSSCKDNSNCAGQLACIQGQCVDAI